MKNCESFCRLTRRAEEVEFPPRLRWNEDRWQKGRSPKGRHLATSGEAASSKLKIQKIFRFIINQQSPKWQGRGIATCACRLLFDHLYEQGLNRITARVDPRNEPCVHLFERLNFVREGMERQCWWDDDYDEWTDEILFAMLASEWPESATASSAPLLP